MLLWMWPPCLFTNLSRQHCCNTQVLCSPKGVKQSSETLRLVSLVSIASFGESCVDCFVWWVLCRLLRLVGLVSIASFGESCVDCFVWWVLCRLLCFACQGFGRKQVRGDNGSFTKASVTRKRLIKTCKDGGQRVSCSLILSLVLLSRRVLPR